jgi:hypothetical protein
MLRLLAACVGPHGYISGASCFTNGDHPPWLRPTGSPPACTGGGGIGPLHRATSLIPPSRFGTHGGSVVVRVRESRLHGEGSQVSRMNRRGGA